ncbi:translation initiation factor IF-2, mitochondrial [Chelonus insularis]|uniref:translation initiation factor IF-2, mitochondrial n=1 Tax=Chelonus insularis TaxID=460826 RepID=UPI00158D237E|nr:translation initiation factor IF-2, mitochondrial [Chelonus insularis]
MAPFLIQMCFKQRYVSKFISEIVRKDHNGAQNYLFNSKVCIECHCYHTTPVYLKRRKTKEEKKLLATTVIQKPKAKSTMPLIKVWPNMTVNELAQAASRSVSDVLQVIEYSGVRGFKQNSVIYDGNLLYAAVKKLGLKYVIVPRPDQVEKDEYEDVDVIKRPPPDPSVLIKRHPVVTVMGHVDHGKTTLLDSLRHTSVAAKEFGGITQHIGAFNVNLDTGERITFLDTPGHAAFRAMRERGANVTDIVILVVAADDGVMEQTIQSIKMAKEAKVPIVVAINKIDKPGADIERTQKMLAVQGILVEAFGGDVPSVNISALKGTNLRELVETVAVLAEVMELKGDPNGMVEGVILEVSTDISRGKLATALIQRGTLRKGCILVGGTAWAKVRGMIDHAGAPISEGKLSEAVQILGWRELPAAGDEFLEVESEKKAHSVIKCRQAQRMKMKAIEDLPEIEKRRMEHEKVYKENLLKKRALGKYVKIIHGLPQKESLPDDGIPKVSIILKADVLGSVEAILEALETYEDENRCHLDVIHYGIGPVSENDVEMAEVFNGMIYTFNINTPKNMQDLAEKSKVPIHSHNVIYKFIDDLKEEIRKKLPPTIVEDKLGEANVLQYFQITEKKKKVSVAGCRCTEGVLKKDAKYKILRNNEIVYEGTLTSMKHHKDEVNSIKTGLECGLRFHDPNVVVQPGDTIICYTTHEEPPSVNWDLGF